jgi:hypothetical protein
VDHAVEYVRDQVHTNGLENFWSLLKRGLNGTYISVEPFHLFRYLDEQAFRYNNRDEIKDFDRFKLAMSQIINKRLTWNQLTGKNADGETCPNREGTREAEARKEKANYPLGVVGFFFFCCGFLYGLGGSALFGTVRIFFIALRNISNASGPSIISVWGFMKNIMAHLEYL